MISTEFLIAEGQRCDQQWSHEELLSLIHYMTEALSLESASFWQLAVAFRANALRWNPALSHDDISAVIAECRVQPGKPA